MKGQADSAKPAVSRLSHRSFLKVAGLAVGLGLVSPLVTSPKVAYAQAIGDPDVTVSGSLYVPSGKVGVGTSAASDLLTLTTVSANDGARLSGNNATFVALLTNLGNGSYCSLSQANDRGIIYGGSAINAPGGGLVLAPWTTGTGGMRLDPNGNVGVGTGNPATTLHVARGACQIGALALSDAADISSSGGLQFYKGPLYPQSQPNRYFYYFDSCGDATANNPFWEGLQVGGPSLTVAAGNTFPRLSLYWDYDVQTNPSYVRATIWAGNAWNGSTPLASLRLGADTEQVQIDGTLNVTSQLNLNGTKAIDNTGTAIQAYYA